MNILHDFFNSRSDASTMEASEQEKLEKEFEIWFEEQLKNYQFASKFLIKHLAENYHPHHSAIVSSDRCEILESSKAFGTDEFIID